MIRSRAATRMSRSGWLIREVPPSIPAVAPCFADPLAAPVAAASEVRVPQPLLMVESSRIATGAKCRPYLGADPLVRLGDRAEADRSGADRPQADVGPAHALADEGRDAERDGGCDLDGLEDHAVGERVGGGDAVAGREDADHGELEDSDVRWRRRDDRGDVD